MKKNNYYLYTNVDELYNFLVKNAVYPSSNKEHAFSLSKRGYIYLTKKRFSKEFIFDTCRIGIMSPIVLEVSIKTSHDKNIVVVSENELLVSSIIPFNSVVSIYSLDGDLPLLLFNDAYLFRSLLSKKDFEYGEDKPTDLNYFPDKDIDDDLNNRWDKIQGFYAARYAPLYSEFKLGKKLMIASNLDEESANELLCQSQNSYFLAQFHPYKKFCFKEERDNSSQISIFINENFNNLLANKKIKTKFDGKDLVSNLFRSCLLFKKGDNFLSAFNEAINNAIADIDKEYQGDIYNLKSILFSEEKETIRFFYLLNMIVSKEYEDALDYLSNFDTLSTIEKKCLMGLYGLCVGMSRLTISIKKKRPDILLFAFNRAKGFFKDFIDSAVSVNDYFESREFVTDFVTKDGFNYVAYNRDFEMNYLKIMFTNKLNVLFKLPKGMVGKDLIRFTTSEELHRTYLLARKGNE